MLLIHITLYYSYYCNYCNYNSWICCRMVGICWISGGIRAWLQETCPVRHSHSEYPGQTSCGTCRWYWNYSAPHAQHLSGRSRRPQAGRRRWMPDVVCQLVGIGMVPWYVMKRGGQFERLLCDMGSMWSRQWVPCDPANAPCLRHIPTRSDGPTPILVGSSSSGGVWDGACLVWGSGIDRMWNWAGANQVLHARAGEVPAKWKRACIASVHISWVK